MEGVSSEDVTIGCNDTDDKHTLTPQCINNKNTLLKVGVCATEVILGFGFCCELLGLHDSSDSAGAVVAAPDCRGFHSDELVTLSEAYNKLSP